MDEILEPVWSRFGQQRSQSQAEPNARAAGDSQDPLLVHRSAPQALVLGACWVPAGFLGED